MESVPGSKLPQGICGIGHFPAISDRFKETVGIMSHCQRHPVLRSPKHQIKCEILHLVTACGFPESVNQRKIRRQHCRGIRKIYHPSVSDIGPGYILPHTADKVIAEKIDLTSGSLVQHLQVVIQLTGGMPPICRTLFTGAVALENAEATLFRVRVAQPLFL